MREQRLKITALGWALLSVASPLLLTQCGKSTAENSEQPSAGASGAEAEAGAAGALGGASEVGGAPTSDAGAAGSVEPEGLAGNATAGTAGVIAGAGGTAAGSGGAAAGTGGAAGSGECGSELTTFSNPSAAHVNVCSGISYPMNPPVYGDHYPVWAAYKSYSFAVPLGFLVHNLEHGAVVVLYNCPEGCADEVASAQAWIDALPADPRCTADVKHQVVMSPDPSLPKRWAAVAWGRSLTANCFAQGSFQAFYEANVGHGSEDICGNGADLTADACL